MERMTQETLQSRIALDREINHLVPYSHHVVLGDDPIIPEFFDRHCMRLVLSGSMQIQNGAYAATIDKDSFYLTNPGRHIRCISLGEEPVRWMVVGFAPDLVSSLQHRRGSGQVFYELKLPLDAEVAQQASKLAVISSGLGLGTTDLQAECDRLLPLVLRNQSGLNTYMERIPARSQKRREELYIRLHRTRDFIDSRFMDDPSIEDLADVAHLSRSHFLRMYRAVFESTPHQDLLDRKLAAACDMLAASRYNITEISNACGFGNRCAFSRLFSQRFNMSPRAYRKAN